LPGLQDATTFLGNGGSRKTAFERKLVESDEVLLTFQILGTAPNAAVHKYLNTKKVPQLFCCDRRDTLYGSRAFPMDHGLQLELPNRRPSLRALHLGQLSGRKDRRAHQNDDLGRDYLSGLKDGLGMKAATMIVAEVPYEVTDPTINSQIVRLRATGADLIYDITTPKFTTQSIKKVAEMDWKPVHILTINSTSIGGVLAPAGLENAKGIASVNYGKDPADPTWNDDLGMKKWHAFMDKYYPEGDKNSSFNTYDYGTSPLMAGVLEMCGDELTRENVMKQATNLKDVVGDLTLPGMSLNTTPTDYRINKQLQMMRFDGERWVLFGPILTADSRS
jgi:branched-chain amino acid transport system substrate-binding protein